MLYTICLPGTVLALLFPNWNFYPVIHFITLEGFLFHMGIVLYVAGKLASHEIRPDFAKLWQVVLFLTAVVIPIYWFDKRYDYKNKDASWKDSKDAIQRGMQKLRGSDPSRPPHMLKK